MVARPMPCPLPPGPPFPSVLPSSSTMIASSAVPLHQQNQVLLVEGRSPLSSPAFPGPFILRSSVPRCYDALQSWLLFSHFRVDESDITRVTHREFSFISIASGRVPFCRGRGGGGGRSDGFARAA